MPLYPEAPQGVLTPGFADFDKPFAVSRPALAIESAGSQPLAAPMDSSAIAAALGNVTPPEVKRPGLLGRIKQQPGGSRALLALGASLLSNPNFFQGLGQGALAYQQVLDDEQAKLQPTPTKDFTFTYRRDPRTGQLVFERTPVAQFEEDQQLRKLQSALAIAKVRDEGDTARLETTMGFRDKWENRGMDIEEKELELRDRWNQRDNETDLRIAELNGQQALQEALLRQGLQADKPPPVGIQKEITAFTSTRDAQANAASQLAPILGAIDRGDLTFSIGSNLRHKAAIATGIGGNAETVFYSQFQTALESLRNALLIANKGVQTDGDAERAMAELIAGTGNTATIKANLATVMRSLGRRQSQAQARIDELARQYGADVSNSSPQSAPAPAPRRQTPRTTGTTNGVRWRIVD